MKTKFKKYSTTILLLFISGYASIVSADSITNASLGATGGAVDYYQISCASLNTLATGRLDIQVKDRTAGASILSLNMQKGLHARKTTDATGGDTGFSPFASIGGGNGIYHVMVSKTTGPARFYDINFHCMNGTTHTVTSYSLKQNQ
jgi:hypothetical protein